MSVEALVAFADEALAGLEHRRVDFDLADAAEPLRAGFVAKGWKAERLVWMRHEAPPPPGPDIAVREVPYDAVHELRVAWHGEDFPGAGQLAATTPRRARSRCAAGSGSWPCTRRARRSPSPSSSTTATRPRSPRSTSTRDYRGGGRGTAMTRAAIEAAGDVRDLWIVADDEDRPEGALRPARLSPGLERRWSPRAGRAPTRRPLEPGACRR